MVTMASTHQIRFSRNKATCKINQPKQKGQGRNQKEVVTNDKVRFNGAAENKSTDAIRSDAMPFWYLNIVVFDHMDHMVQLSFQETNLVSTVKNTASKGTK